MNMNNLGKGLVLVHLTLSMIAVSWATGLYFQFLDYGWLEPSKDLDKRVASEYEKRVASFVLLREQVAKDLPGIKNLTLELHRARQHFGDNHVVYRDLLENMKSGKKPKDKDLTFPATRFKDGGLELAKSEPYSPPLLSDVLADVDNSREGYVKQRQDLIKLIEVQIDMGRKLTKSHAEISKVLLGKDGGEKDLEAPGLYKLLEDEKKRQDEARFELDYLEKIWAPVLQEAEIFILRRLRLEKTLEGLLKGKAKAPEKGKA